MTPAKPSIAPKPELRFWLTALCAGIISAMLFWNAFQAGKSQWENLGDAHFYAQSAEHWYQTGQNRWFEIYPIALKANSGITMAFGAPGQSLCAALVMLFGAPKAQATLMVSSGSIAILFFLITLFFFSAFRSSCLALSAGILCLHTPSLWGFAKQGGSDALGLLCFCSALIALLSFTKCHKAQTTKIQALNQPVLPPVSHQRSFYLCLLLCVVGALVRPQNQLLLLSIPFCLFLYGERSLKNYGACLGALLLWKLLQTLLLQGQSLVFPYSFSFLVGTTPFPDHSLFSHYFSDGFGLPQVWEHRDLWAEKIHKGLGLLKMYWPSWLATLVFCGLSPIVCRRMWPIALILCSITVGLMALSATGHLVPRYWTFMALPAVVIFIFSLSSRVRSSAFFGQRALPIFLLIASLTSLQLNDSPWLKRQQERQLHHITLPTTIVKILSQARGVTTDAPRLLIHHAKQPVLLLPHSAAMLDQINREVESIEWLMLSPQLPKGERKHWLEEQRRLQNHGYHKVDLDPNWVCYQKRSTP